MTCHEADIVKYKDIREHTKYKSQKHQMKIPSRDKWHFHTRNNTSCFTDLLLISEKNGLYWTHWENEATKITKCDKDTKVLFCKVTKRAIGPKLAMYDDNGDVIRISFVELFCVTERRLHWASRASIVALKEKNWETLPNKYRSGELQSRANSSTAKSYFLNIGLITWENCA